MARLLDTKLQPPPLREERLYRPHLYGHLADLESGVVVVSAPPGFGKSTLVVEWLTSQNRPFAWYSLDRYDGDVGLFGEYLGRAVGSLTGHESGLLSMPGERTPDPRSMIAMLVEDMAQVPPGAVLVLDDYHEIDNKDVHEAVRYLVDNLPDHLLLVIITRADPPIPLSRLRALDRLREIRGVDLRLTEDQVAEYLRLTAGIELDTDQTKVVTERSEGWVSALQLASLGIDRAEPSRVVTSLSAQHPHIADYLVDEVLDRLDPVLAGFLLDTSPLRRFDHQLCRSVTGVDDPGALLAEIERQNAFLIPLGQPGAWYRYHHLFADLLRSRLKRSDPDRYVSLLRRAAEVCEERGLPDDAIGYALEAGDLARAAEIVQENIGVVLGTGQVPRLRSWLRLFPVPAGAAAHVMALGWAWCRIFEGDPQAAGELIDRLEAEHVGDFADDPSGQLEVMRAMLALQAGDASGAESHARRSLENLPEDAVYMESLADLYVGRALHAQASREEARPYLERAASLAERGNTLAAVTALFWLGVVEMDEGSLVAAERSMTRAREVASMAASPTGDPHPAAGVGDVGLAYVRLNQLEIEEAIRLAETGSRLLQRSTFVEMVFRAFFVWAEALSLAGRFDDSRAVSEEGIDWLEGRIMGGGPLETWLMMSQARNAWRRRDFDEAKLMLDRVRERGLGSPTQDEAMGFYETADEVSYMLRKGDLEEARRLLDELPPDPGANVMFAIKRCVLRAGLHELDGDPRSAVESITRALDLAREGYRFQFSHVAPVIEPVLKRLVGRSDHDDLIRSILDRLPVEGGATPRQPIDPLTPREIEVLNEIALGHTNEDIADRLFISRGTVKRHASNIYLKLGAHHRSEAAAKGRELGLID